MAHEPWVARLASLPGLTDDEKGKIYGGLLHIEDEGKKPEKYFPPILSDMTVVAALKSTFLRDPALGCRDWEQRLNSLVVDGDKSGKIRLRLLDRDTNYRAAIFNGDDDSVRTSLLNLLEPAAATVAGLSSGVSEKLLQELVEYMAEEKARRQSKRSVCLSSVTPSIWDTIQQQFGLKIAYKDIIPNLMSDLPNFGWDNRVERAQADRYTMHLNKIKHGQVWELIDTANNHPTLLSGTFVGWNFKGTTDVAFVHRRASKLDESCGLRIIFKLKKDIGVCGYRKAANQTLICLVMANLFSQQFKPLAVLTDLNDNWHLYWMDGLTIYRSPCKSRAAAVGYIEELLQDFDDNEMGTSEAGLHGEAADVQFIKNRKMFETPGMDKLNDLVGLIPDEEIRSARVQLGLQYLHGMMHSPLLFGVPDVDMPWASHM